MNMDDRVDAALEVLSEAVVCGLINGFRVYQAEQQRWYFQVWKQGWVATEAASREHAIIGAGHCAVDIMESAQRCERQRRQCGVRNEAGGLDEARRLAQAALDCANAMTDEGQARRVAVSALYSIAHGEE